MHTYISIVPEKAISDGSHSALCQRTAVPVLFRIKHIPECGKRYQGIQVENDQS